MNEPLCLRCGVEMEAEENLYGQGHCFCCASTHGPKSRRRSFNESAIEMGCAEEMES
jgi:hypothetical protein